LFGWIWDCLSSLPISPFESHYILREPLII
jgi:hypothetical protein